MYVYNENKITEPNIHNVRKCNNKTHAQILLVKITQIQSIDKKIFLNLETHQYSSVSCYKTLQKPVQQERKQFMMNTSILKLQHAKQN